MKLILLLLSFAFAWTVQAQDTANEKLKVTGAARVRFENQEFTSQATDSTQYTSIRIRPNLTYKANDQLEFVAEPQFAKRMGAQAYIGSSTTQNTLTETSGNTSYEGDSVNVFQGYMNVKFNSQLSLKAGRQVLKYGDELILGPANWGTYGRSFDAVVARWANYGGYVDLIHAKVTDFGVRNTSGDRDLNGVYTSWDLGFWLKSVDAYWLTRDTNGAANTTANHYSVAGARAMFDFQILTLSAEYAKGDGSEQFVNDGSETDMYTAVLGYKINDKHKVSLEYSHAGKNWNELYPTTNRALGRADVVGRRNLDAMALHWSSEFSDYFGLDFDYYRFTRASSDTRIYQTNSTTAFGSATRTSEDIGSEFDLALRYKQNSALNWNAGYAYFIAGDYLKDTATDAARKDRNPQFFYVMLEAKF